MTRQTEKGKRRTFTDKMKDRDMTWQTDRERDRLQAETKRDMTENIY